MGTNVNERGSHMHPIFAVGAATLGTVGVVAVAPTLLYYVRDVEQSSALEKQHASLDVLLRRAEQATPTLFGPDSPVATSEAIDQARRSIEALTVEHAHSARNFLISAVVVGAGCFGAMSLMLNGNRTAPDRAGD